MEDISLPPCEGVLPNSFPGTLCSLDRGKIGYFLRKLLLDPPQLSVVMHSHERSQPSQILGRASINERSFYEIYWFIKKKILLGMYKVHCHPEIQKQKTIKHLQKRNTSYNKGRFDSRILCVVQTWRSEVLREAGLQHASENNWLTVCVQWTLSLSPQSVQPRTYTHTHGISFKIEQQRV